MQINEKWSKCILCNKKEFLKLKNNFKYVNSDITFQKKKCDLKLCKVCGALQKNIDLNYLNNLSILYKKYNIYDKFNTQDQAKFNDKGKVDPRSFLIFNKLIKKFKFKKSPNILDYGSGNGNMLRPFLSKNYHFNLYACDVKNNLSKDILYSTKFINIKKLNRIKKNFDLIILSHSLEHLINPIKDLKLLSNKLNASGKIIIQIPNYQSNPFDLIVYDHTIHFDINSINFLSFKCNINIDKVYNNIITDEFTIVCSKNNKQKKIPIKKNFEKKIKKKIELLKKYILIFKKLKSFSILGSSISSLWLISMYKNKIINIYDEDLSRIGTKIGDNIIKSLNSYNDEKIALPFSKNKLSSIQNRFAKKKYKLVKFFQT